MVKGSIKKIVQFLGNTLKEEGLSISKIILFGSHARGTSAEESDIDIVIVSKDFKGKSVFDRAKLTKKA